MTFDCRHAQPRSRRASAWLLALVFAGALSALVPMAASAQEHAAAVPAEQGAEHTEGHDGGILPVVARLFNFALLAGALAYFLKTPVATYLAARSTQIREDLVTAADMRSAATAELAAIEAKLAALPAELAALKARGAEDVAAERARIAAAAAAERERLVEQTRREIDLRLRVARRDLTEHAATLAVRIAEARIRRAMTPDDQLRLVDRYTAQLREAR